MKYPDKRINHHIMSMSRQVDAGIMDNGVNNFNF